jgi:hypothetical protein
MYVWITTKNYLVTFLDQVCCQKVEALSLLLTLSYCIAYYYELLVNIYLLLVVIQLLTSWGGA